MTTNESELLARLGLIDGDRHNIARGARIELQRFADSGEPDTRAVMSALARLRDEAADGLRMGGQWRHACDVERAHGRSGDRELLTATTAEQDARANLADMGALLALVLR